MRAVVLGLIVFLLSSCEDKLEDRPDYKKGYEVGYDDGENDGTAHTCWQIKDYKGSMYDALQEAKICP